MKPDDFEARLARVPLPPPPPDWRREILHAAHQAAVDASPTTRESRPTPTSMASAWLSWVGAFRHRLVSPAGMLAGGWGLVLVLFSFNHLLDLTRPANAHPVAISLAVAPSRTATLAAARSYQAHVNALAADDDARDVDLAPASPALPVEPRSRPRSELTPLHVRPPRLLHARHGPADRAEATAFA